MAKIQKIRQKIADRNYYLSSHAEEEMYEDDLTRRDIENAIHKGTINKKLSEDSRGTRYRIEGPAEDGRRVHIICRFNEEGALIVITLYALTEDL